MFESSGRIVALGTLASLLLSATARAADPLNSNNRLSDDQPSSSPQDANDKNDDAPHTDFNIVPVAGGSTDLGIGGGFFAGLVRNQKNQDPFLWNIDSSGLITFKYSARAGLTSPYQDIYVRLTIPRLFGAPLRLEVRPSYTFEDTYYYGLGNASSSAAPANSPSGYFSFQRAHPQLDVEIRGRIIDHFAVHTGFRFTHNAISADGNSKLVQDARSGSAEVRHLLGEIQSSSVALLKYGVQWDTRDNEISSHSGMYDTLDLKLSPGPTEMFPYRYGQATLNLRAFVPLSKPKFTLAVRVVGDVLFGNAPFFELARFDDTSAIGGTKGVRGVPAQRYYGKVKTFANIELRAELFTFHAFHKNIVFAFVPFFDGGRLWADTKAEPELDGRSFGLKYGAGGGVHLQSGSAFVISADLAWSPDATPISGYFSAGQMF
ncbi:MAG TPA: BamA/TamA family outer membrane protein [Polyangiaceae bacterium]